MKAILSGKDYVVFEADNGLILKFPRRDSPKLEKEAAFLKLIAGRLSTPTPTITHEGKQFKYFAYKKIVGDSLYSEHFQKATSHEVGMLAADLAHFAWELHSHISCSAACAVCTMQNAASDNWEVAQLQAIAAELPLSSGDRDCLLDAVAEYADQTPDCPDVVLHHDLSNDNIVINPSTRRLSGIIDFGNVTTGERVLEFAFLYRRRSDLALKVTREYERISRVRIPRRKIQLYAAMKQLTKIRELGPMSSETPLAQIVHWCRARRCID